MLAHSMRRVISGIGGGISPYEDFTTYTEVDVPDRYTVSTNKIIVSDLTRNETAYIYKDKGAAHFDGDYTIRFKVNIEQPVPDTDTGHIYFFMLSNTLGIGYPDIHFSQPLNTAYPSLLAANWTLVGGDRGAVGSNSVGSVLLNYDTDYWIEVFRDENVGANGTLYVRAFTDAGFITMVEEVTTALVTAKYDYRYIYPANSQLGVDATTINCTIENYDLGGL